MLPLLLAALLVQDNCERTPHPSLHGDGLEELMDSAQAVRGLEAVWSDDFDFTIAYVSYDSLDVYRRVVVLSQNADEDETTRLASALAGVVDQTVPQTESVLLILGDHDGLDLKRVERFNLCRPRITNRRTVQSRAVKKALSLGPQIRGQSRRAYVWLFVTEQGLISESRIAQSSGNFRIDRAAIEVAEGVEFEPGRREGIPVAVWVRFPVTFHVR